MGKDQLVLAGQGVELVGGGDEGLAGELGDGLGDLDVKARGGVEAVPTAVPPRASSLSPGRAISSIFLSFSAWSASR